MKFKIDENLPKELADLLRDAGHDAATIHEERMIGAADASIAQVCQAEERCILTLDVDFADIRHYPPEQYPGIIVFRVSRKDKPSLLELAGRLRDELTGRELSKTLWIVEENRIRIRRRTSGKEPSI
jgi:predicted nuclease of predicted toxin-antitoxin system